jgi:hypothetical protein
MPFGLKAGDVPSNPKLQPPEVTSTVSAFTCRAAMPVSASLGWRVQNPQSDPGSSLSVVQASVGRLRMKRRHDTSVTYSAPRAPSFFSSVTSARRPGMAGGPAGARDPLSMLLVEAAGAAEVPSDWNASRAAKSPMRNKVPIRSQVRSGRIPP